MKRFQPAVILAAGWAAFLVYAYPGTLTFDSIDILIQARAGSYRDDQPAVVTALWALVEHVIAGPFGMLVIQSVALLAGLYLVFRKTFEARGAAIAAVAVFLFPPVMTPMTAIWKDPLMAGLLVLGTGCLLHRKNIAGLVVLMVAGAVRFNAPAATLAPVVLLLAWRWTGWRRYAIAAAAWAVTAAAALWVNPALADRQTYAWSNTVAIYDITGTLARVDETVPDDKLRELLAGSGLLVDRDIHATIRALFDPKDYLKLVTDPHRALWHFSLENEAPPPPEFRAAMARTWKWVVTTYPAAFLVHRLRTLDLVLDSDGGGVPWRGEAQKELRAAMHLPNGANALQVAIYRQLVKLERRSHIFTPWVYFLVAIILLPIAWRERDVLALLASALAYEGTLLAFAATRDYRYSHWLVTACCIAIVTLTARRSRVKVRA